MDTNTVGYWLHEPGKLSRGAVLDVGLKCMHSCKFCYYSYLDKSADQFGGMRKADFRTVDQCKQILQSLKAQGFKNFDYTGGEPALHPDIIELTRFAHNDLGLVGRMITLGQYLMRKMPNCQSPRLIDDLLGAGIVNFLFSLHAVEEELFHRISGESFEKLRSAMEYLDSKNFQYTTNTTVFEWNYRHLPDIAREVVKHNIYFHNFIIMNAYHEWNKDGRAYGVRAKYADIHPYLQEAVNILESAKVGVNIRYAPLCAVKGMERNLVGVVGVRYDPYEWMNVGGHTGGPPELCASQIPIQQGGVEAYVAYRPETAKLPNGLQLSGVRGNFFKCFPENCKSCASRDACDGIDHQYLGAMDPAEFKPYRTGGGFPLHPARLAYKPAYVVKSAQFTDMKTLIADAFEQMNNPALAKTAASATELVRWKEGDITLLRTPEFANRERVKVSVIIPCYNYARFLPDAVGSVLRQTFDDYEIIIVNDGSTDHSKELAVKLLSENPARPMLLIDQPNAGQPAISRNNGIRRARGEYILCLDADDLIEPTMLSECAAALDANKNVGVAYTDRCDFNNDNPSDQKIYKAEPYNLHRLRTACHIWCCSMFRKTAWEKVGGYRTNVRGMEDWDFWIACGAKGVYGHYIPKPLFDYRLHGESLFTEVKKNFQAKMAQVFLNNAELYTPEELAWARGLLGQAAPAPSTSPSFDPKTSTVLLFTDDPTTYGTAQYNHMLLCELHKHWGKVVCVQSRAENTMVKERVALGIEHQFLEYDTVNNFSKTVTDTETAQRIFSAVKPALIIFSDCCPFSSFAGKHTAMAMKIPIVTVVHCTAPYLAKNLPQLLEPLKVQYAYARSVITVSNASLKLLHQHYGLAANKGVAIYNGRPHRYFAAIDLAARENLRKAHGIPDQAVVCLTTARLEKAKGYQHLLPVMERLKTEKDWSKLYFVWAGKGPLEEILRRELKARGVLDHVRMIGECENVPEWLSASDILIHPSHFETISLSVLEAMARGLAVAASSVGGVPEALGSTGKLLADPTQDEGKFTLELTETLLSWTRDAKLRMETGAQSRKRAVEMFTEQRMLRDTLAVLDAALKNPAAKAPDTAKPTGMSDATAKATSEIEQARSTWQSCRNFAKMWETAPPEKLQEMFQGNHGDIFRRIQGSGIKNMPLDATDRMTLTRLSAEIATNPRHPTVIGKLIACMLLGQPHHMNVPCEIFPIPDWLIDDFTRHLFPRDYPFYDVGEADAYRNCITRWVDYFHEKINAESSLYWRKVALHFKFINSFMRLYFTAANLKSLSVKMAAICEQAMRYEGCAIDWTPPKPEPGARLRLGIVCQDFGPRTETFTTLPCFEHLDRSKFEIFAYAVGTGEWETEKRVRSLVDHFTVLPKVEREQVSSIRNDNLDCLIIGTNCSAVLNTPRFLAFHRLARVQVVNNSTPVSTGIRNVDYYLSGTLNEPEKGADDHYSEKLLKLEGPVHCFNYTADTGAPTVALTRAMLGGGNGETLFVSGANFYKIVPEIRHTWARILAAVPNSKLVLYPFNLNWANAYPTSVFVDAVRAVFAKYGVDGGRRLTICNTLPARADIHSLLKNCDVYLDSYPFTGVNSTFDPLSVNVPPVVRRGENFRSMMASSLLRDLNLPELVADTEEDYIRLAVELGSQPERREMLRTRIQASFSASPRFLDTVQYGQQMNELLQRICTETGAPPGIAVTPGSYKVIGPNAPCPCSSGRKYKRCCGASV